MNVKTESDVYSKTPVKFPNVFNDINSVYSETDW